MSNALPNPLDIKLALEAWTHLVLDNHILFTRLAHESDPEMLVTGVRRLDPGYRDTWPPVSDLGKVEAAARALRRNLNVILLGEHSAEKSKLWYILDDKLVDHPDLAGLWVPDTGDLTLATGMGDGGRQFLRGRCRQDLVLYMAYSNNEIYELSMNLQPLRYLDAQPECHRSVYSPDKGIQRELHNIYGDDALRSAVAELLAEVLQAIRPTYTVWLTVEKADELSDRYEDMDLPFGGVEHFDDLEKATAFATKSQAVLKAMAAGLIGGCRGCGAHEVPQLSPVSVGIQATCFQCIRPLGTFWYTGEEQLAQVVEAAEEEEEEEEEEEPGS